MPMRQLTKVTTAFIRLSGRKYDGKETEWGAAKLIKQFA